MATVAEELLKLRGKVFQPSQPKPPTGPGGGTTSPIRGGATMPAMPGIRGTNGLATPATQPGKPTATVPSQIAKPADALAAVASLPPAAAAGDGVTIPPANAAAPPGGGGPVAPDQTSPLPLPNPDPGTPPPGPAPGAPQTYNDSVVDRFNEITASDNPLIRMARQNGIALGNRRGLANSSMAAGAAEAEAYKAALPLAQQEASQALQKNLANTSIAAEMERLQAQLAGASETQRVDILAQMERLRVSGEQELTRLQTAAGLDQSRMRLQGEIDTALQATGGEQQRALATLQGSIQSALQTQVDASAMQRLAAQFAQDLATQDRDNAAKLTQIAASGDQEIRSILIRAQEERQNLSMQIAAGDRQAIAASMISVFQAEASIRAALLSNTNIPASERSAYERAISSLGAPLRAFIDQLYTVTPPPAGQSPGTPAYSAPPTLGGGLAGAGEGGGGGGASTQLSADQQAALLEQWRQQQIGQFQ